MFACLALSSFLIPPPFLPLASQDVSSASLATLQPLCSSVAILSRLGLPWAVAFPYCLMSPEEGSTGHVFQGKARCLLLPLLFKTHISWDSRLQARSRAASCSEWYSGLIPFCLWALVSWGARNLPIT